MLQDGNCEVTDGTACGGFIALSLVLTLGRKAMPLHLVASSLLTSGINGASLLNLQQLMVFTLVEKINAVALL